eukprot:3409532-Rhodomonas_salina.2
MRYAYLLRLSYALSGTGAAHGATAVCGTELARMGLPVWRGRPRRGVLTWRVGGAEVTYGGTLKRRMAVLKQRMGAR